MGQNEPLCCGAKLSWIILPHFIGFYIFADSIMVRIYVRKTERQNWTIEAAEAIEAAENGMCICTASTTLNVPRMALKRRIIKRRAGITTQPLRSLGSFHCVFTEDQEAELLRYIFDMEKRMYS
ncbi:hypothetical protein JTB14_033136 [Gonioctena quinquepunctata]|nr:hypothetical protein JTB14_033136 [Gonioctena quinquepunctata]